MSELDRGWNDNGCATCGGPLIDMGQLGERQWFRCRNCGLDQYSEAIHLGPITCEYPQCDVTSHNRNDFVQVGDAYLCQDHKDG